MNCERSCVFRHQPLDSPSTQIRLLEIEPAGVNDSQIACSLTHWDLANAPAYSAVSYTWGPQEPTCVVSVNDRRFVALENCHLALWQLRLHGAARYYWLDSICIDQNNVEEKNRQVQMMGSIYAEAQDVLVSLGPHAGDSAFAAKMLRALEVTVLRVNRPRRARDNALSSAIVKWLLDIGEQVYLRLEEAIWNLGEREYWNRVWIIQELVLARDITMFCGDMTIEYMPFEALVLVLTDESLRPQVLSHRMRFYKVMGALPAETTDPRRDFQDLLQTFADARCFDVRDHIYGALSLTDWAGSEPIEADYNASATELARRALKHLAGHRTSARSMWASVEHLLTMLELCSSSPDLESLLRKRRDMRYCATSCTQRGLPESRGDLLPWPLYATVRLCNRIVATDTGDLTLVPAVKGEWEVDRDGLKILSKLRGLCSGEAHAAALDPPRDITVEGAIVGIASSSVQAGDILVAIARQPKDGQPLFRYLALRQRHGSEVHDFAGQVATVGAFNSHKRDGRNLLRPHRLIWNRGGVGPPTQSDAAIRQGFDLYFCAADLLALVGQGLPSKHETDPLRLEANRLRTRVNVSELSSYAMRVSQEAFEELDGLDFVDPPCENVDAVNVHHRSTGP